MIEVVLPDGSSAEWSAKTTDTASSTAPSGSHPHFVAKTRFVSPVPEC